MITPMFNQAETASHLYKVLLGNRAALDASDTGVGKTYVALMVAQQLDLPIGVICTKSGESVWNEAIQLAELQHKVKFVHNYSKLTTGKTTVARCNKKFFYWDEGLKDTLLIFDEVHRCKGMTTRNCKMLIGSRRVGAYTLLLSATCAESPLDMKSIGYVLGLHDLYDYETWLMAKGAKWNKELYYWSWKPKNRHERIRFDEHLIEMHRNIFPNKGIRVRKEDIPGFPTQQIIAEKCHFAGAKTACKELLKKIEDIEESLLDVTCDLSFMQKERTRLELTKVEVFVEKTKDLVAEGNSVIIFANFKETVGELCKKLKTECCITGDTKKHVRTERMAEFQSGAQRIIIFITAAGSESISLHDLDGKFPRYSLMFPSWNARDVKQALGRTQRLGGKSHSIACIIYAADSIEEDACDALRKKTNNMDALNDGDLQKGFIPAVRS